MENQHREITGYRDLDRSEIDLFNLVKQAEAAYAEVWRQVKRTPGVDQRYVSLARTHVETGTMFLGRAVGRAVSPFDSPDPLADAND